jgi:hypothetical protein
MTLKYAVIPVLIALLLASPVGAQQDAVNHQDVWGRFAERLGPGAFVTVHLKNGSHIKGHLIAVSADALQVKPKTRIAVPMRAVPLDAIESIEPKHEGMSPGSKVALGVGVGLGTTLVLIFLAFLSSGY